MRRRTASCGALALLSAGALAAQQPPAADPPEVPAGVPVVVLPVQSAVPDGEGAWAGGTGSAARTIDLLNAEIEFAFGEEEGAAHWALAPAVEARLARNPTIGVDPGRLAYRGLLAAPDARAQLYEPLHTQLRQVAALFGARLVVLPLAVSYRERRAVLQLAVIDVRRSAVLWHGAVAGAAAEAASPFALTTLALRVADRLAPS
ncbi:hypothetical protein [Candidatus Palauibacter irciniicola]|uniref:hypothetical protein n=1 Tax=Candidatus Palauibacter irciniicola TaxID=3056733 RepID=UPI003B024338